MSQLGDVSDVSLCSGYLTVILKFGSESAPWEAVLLPRPNQKFNQTQRPGQHGHGAAMSMVAWKGLKMNTGTPRTMQEEMLTPRETARAHVEHGQRQGWDHMAGRLMFQKRRWRSEATALPKLK